MTATETELVCIDGLSGTPCGGTIEYRCPLSRTGRSFPRCDRHWDQRLDREERLRADYPDSPMPPSWFDPADAGETWDDGGW